MKITTDGIKEFIIKHYQYFGVGILFLTLVVVLLIFSAGRKDKEKESVSTVSEVSADTAAIPVPETELQVDAYTEVNTLVSSYFNAMASGDTDTLSGICSNLDETEKIRIQKKAEYTEDYRNFTCYTKPGPETDSYIVFAYYEIKFKDIDTLAPGLTSLYICKDDKGSLYVYSGELSDSVNDYIRGVAAQDDVVELLNKVDTKYTEAAAADPSLKSFMEALPSALDEAVSTELAAQSEATATESDNAAGGETAPTEGTAASETVKAIDTVNIRKSASETGEKLGKAATGDTFTRLETMENGWSKIDYNGTEAYVKSEYLAASGEAAPTDEPAPEKPAEEKPATDNTESSGQSVVVKETVKIRESASTDGKKLGSAYMGEKFELINRQADGWCKIKYKGQTAYVNADYVDIK